MRTILDRGIWLLFAHLERRLFDIEKGRREHGYWLVKAGSRGLLHRSTKCHGAAVGKILEELLLLGQWALIFDEPAHDVADTGNMVLDFAYALASHEAPSVQLLA